MGFNGFYALIKAKLTAVKAEITAPEEGTVFFVQSNPLAFAGGQLMLILR